MVIKEEYNRIIINVVLFQPVNQCPQCIIKPQEIFLVTTNSSRFASLLKSLPSRQNIKRLIKDPVSSYSWVCSPCAVFYIWAMRNSSCKIEEKRIILIFFNKINAAFCDPIQVMHSQCTRAVAVRIIMINACCIIKTTQFHGRLNLTGIFS